VRTGCPIPRLHLVQGCASEARQSLRQDGRHVPATATANTQTVVRRDNGAEAVHFNSKDHGAPEWHAHCTSWLDEEANRVAWRDEHGEEVVAPAIAAMPVQELGTETWTECDYIDLTVSWVDDDERPKEWRCPKCGGKAFEGVHRDYMHSGL
jgi:hypothetical protein